MKPIISEVPTGADTSTSSSPTKLSVPSSSITSSTAQCLFRDQLATLSNWFDQWNKCEQTVALYSLLNKLNATQARFISYSLQNIFNTNQDIQRLENAANNPAFISSLRNETKENAIVNLLNHLPLLHPGNEECKVLYLSLVTKILGHSVANAAHLDESRQLLSYALIHPALSNEDRRMLTSYYRNLEDVLIKPNHVIGKETSNYSTYHNYLNGGANSYQANNFSISDSELFPLNNNNNSINNNNNNSNNSNNNLINSWHTNSSTNGSTIDTGPTSMHCFGSNSLPSGITPAQIALHGINTGAITSQDILINGANHQNPTTLMHNLIRLRRSNSLTPTSSNGISSITNGSINGNHNPLNGFTDSSRLEKSFISGAGTSIMMNNFNKNQLDWKINGAQSHINRNNMSKNNINNNNNNDQELHNTLSPQHSVASSGSGSSSENCLNNLDKKSTFDIPWSGMKAVPGWLKKLRLHKYSNLFSNMTYEQMLQLTEEELERLNITKGARHKIILHIQKLNDRSKILRSLQKELNEEGVKCLRQTLSELREMLNTPIKSYADGSHNNNNNNNNNSNNKYSYESVQNLDEKLMFTNNNIDSISFCDNLINIPDNNLPELITRLIGKIYSIINGDSQIDDECLKIFISLTEKCCAHEAFSTRQITYLTYWQQNVQKLLDNLPVRRSSDGRQNNRGKWGQNFCNVLSNSTFGKIGPNSLNMSIPPRKRSPSFCSNIDTSLTQQNKNLQLAVSPTNDISLNNKSSLHDEINAHTQVNRTSSAPIRRNTMISSQNFSRETDREQLNDIESLCIRMTEQALG